jgi:cation transport ATPase
MRPPKHYRHHDHHNHHKSHSQLGHPHLETRKQTKLKTQPPCHSCPVPEKGHGLIATEDAAERGGGRIQTLLLTVQGMECSPCAQKVTRALLTLPSVQDVKVNIFKGQASLTYREGLISPSDIAKRATRLAGLACMVDDKSQLEGKYRILRIKFLKNAGLLPESPVLPLGVVILKISRTESTVVFDVQYDAALIQPRSVLEIFASLGGSFLPPSKSTTTSQVTGDITSRLRRTLISAILTIPVIVFSWAPLPPHPIIYGAISLFLATCIQIYVGAPLYSAAFHALFMQHVLDMDVLVTISSTIAYVFSLIAYVLQTAGHGFGTTFFETPTLLLTLITLGKLISAYSRRRATSVIDGLGTLQPDFVQMLSADGTTVMVTHVDLLQPLDVLRVPSNTLIPTDGIVLRGLTQVDESALTGESVPVDKAPGTPITAGTRNMTNSIDMEVVRAPAENTLAEVASLVAHLQEARLPVQDLADRAASFLAPVILAVAVITFVIWIVIGLHIRGEHLSKAILAALRYTIAVLVVSCPCAVVLCVPMVIIITGAVAIREGVLFKVSSTHVPISPSS